MPSDDPRTREVVELFRGLLHALLKSSVPAWLELRLTLPQLRTLFIVAHAITASVMQVSQALGVGEPTASHLLDRLVHAGLVERTEDPADRRRALIRLTTTGDELIERLLGWEELLGATLREVPEEDLSSLRQGLEAMMRQIRSHHSGSGAEATSS